MIEIRRPIEADAWGIASRMRPGDRKELAACGKEPLDALIRGMNISTMCWTATYKGSPSVMFGVSPVNMLTGIGSPWLLGTPDVRNFRKLFLTECDGYIAKMIQVYPVLMNFVDVRNVTSIRWLKWLGFEILPPIVYGDDGELFHPFQMRVH